MGRLLSYLTADALAQSAPASTDHSVSIQPRMHAAHVRCNEHKKRGCCRTSVRTESCCRALHFAICLQEEAISSRGAEAAEDLRTQVERLEEDLLDASQRLMAADAARQAERFVLSPAHALAKPLIHTAAKSLFWFCLPK